MLPTPASVHKNAALSNISVMHRNQNYIAERVFPNVQVQKQSDYYYKFLKGAWFRNEAALRSPGADARRGGYVVTADTFTCKEYAFAHPVPIELINNADAAIKPMTVGVEFATNKILLKKEILMSSVVCTAGNWTSSDDVAGGWVAGTGNTFIEDILGAKETIRRLIGVYPNVLLMDAKTFKECKMEDDVLERIKYSGTQGRPADVTAQTLAQLFELDEVMIGTALYSDAEEVLAGTDFNAVDLWEVNATKGSAFLYYRPPSAGLMVPASGYVFNWPSDAGQETRQMSGGGPVRTVRQWWEDSPKQYVIEASECFDIKVVSADAGFLFYDTILT